MGAVRRILERAAHCTLQVRRVSARLADWHPRCVPVGIHPLFLPAGIVKIEYSQLASYRPLVCLKLTGVTDTDGLIFEILLGCGPKQLFSTLLDNNPGGADSTN